MFKSEYDVLTRFIPPANKNLLGKCNNNHVNTIIHIFYSYQSLHRNVDSNYIPISVIIFELLVIICNPQFMFYFSEVILFVDPKNATSLFRFFDE